MRIDAHTLSLLVDKRVAKAMRSAIVARMQRGAQLTVRVGDDTDRSSASTAAGALGAEGCAAGAAPARSGSSRRCRGRSSGCSSAPAIAFAPRQPLVVVEAMKMENELRAGRDGTVADIHAREGMSVEAGALLVVIQ